LGPSEENQPQKEFSDPSLVESKCRDSCTFLFRSGCGLLGILLHYSISGCCHELLASGLGGRHRFSSFDLFLPFVACYGPLVGSGFAGVYGQLVFLAGPHDDDDDDDDGFLTESNLPDLLVVDGRWS
jgi:hypothetical protein